MVLQVGVRRVFAAVLMLLSCACSNEASQSPASSTKSALPPPPPPPPPPVVDWNAIATRGFALYDAPNRDRDQAQAQKLFQDACDHQNSLGCAGLGITYMAGVDGTGKDGAKGVKLLTAACESKVGRACSALSVVYASGLGVEKDTIKAAELAHAACDMGEERGCAQYAGRLFTGEDRVLKDPQQGFKLAKAACDGGVSSGCAILNVAYTRGDGTERNPAEAQNALQKACDLEDGASCMRLAVQYFGYGDAKPSEKAAAMVTRACELGEQRACSDLAGRMLEGSGAVQQDKARAQVLAEAACSKDDTYGCGVAGIIAQRDHRSNDAVQFWTRGCKLGDKKVCGLLAAQQQQATARSAPKRECYEGAGCLPFEDNASITPQHPWCHKCCYGISREGDGMYELRCKYKSEQ